MSAQQAEQDPITQMLLWPECGELYDEVYDPVHVTKQHGKRSTYADGCRGPMCKKAEKDRGRIRFPELAAAEGRVLHPRPRGRKDNRDYLVELVTEWQNSNILEARKQKRESKQKKGGETSA